MYAPVIAAWEQHVRRTCKKATLKRYSHAIRWLLESRTQSLESYRKFLHEKNYAPNTINYCVTIARLFLTWCVQHEQEVRALEVTFPLRAAVKKYQMKKELERCQNGELEIALAQQLCKFLG
jgi:hypothetical protein